MRRQVRDGVPHGPSESWHKSRKQGAVGAFAHGAKDGIWLYWDDAGRELGREIWLAGELRGRPVVSERVPPPA